MSDLTWPADKMAKMIDVTPRHLRRMVSEGIIPKHERGRYNPFAVNIAYIRYLPGPADVRFGFGRQNL